MTDGRFCAFGRLGRVAIDGFEGSVVGRETFDRFPAPPNEGREPPKEGVPPMFPPIFGIEGREFTFPKDGRDALGSDIFGVLGLDILGMFGRAPPPPMFPMDGLAPPPPMLPMDGLAPPPPMFPMDGLAPPPPPPPRPRCANASGKQTDSMPNTTKIAERIRM